MAPIDIDVGTKPFGVATPWEYDRSSMWNASGREVEPQMAHDEPSLSRCMKSFRNCSAMASNVMMGSRSKFQNLNLGSKPYAFFHGLSFQAFEKKCLDLQDEVVSSGSSDLLLMP